MPPRFKADLSRDEEVNDEARPAQWKVLLDRLVSSPIGTVAAEVPVPAPCDRHP